MKKYAIDPSAIGKAVRLANAGRDRELATLEAELKKGRVALATASKAATALVDAVEKDVVEGGGQGGPGLRARLREREAAAQALRLEVEDLEFRRDALRQKFLDDEVVAEGYERLPALLDEARELGAQELLRGLLQAVVDVVEWREDEGDPKKGTATIMFYELPEGFWAAVEAQKEERPGEHPSIRCSPSRPVWLRRSARRRTSVSIPMRFSVDWSRAILGLEKHETRPVRQKPLPNPVARARELQRALAVEGSAADVARAFGMTRAGVSQYLSLVRRLPGDLLDQVEALVDRDRLQRLSLRQLLAVSRMEGEGKRRRALVRRLRHGG